MIRTPKRKAAIAVRLLHNGENQQENVAAYLSYCTASVSVGSVAELGESNAVHRSNRNRAKSTKAAFRIAEMGEYFRMGD